MATIKQLMLERCVLLLSGVRQCGKTTLAHQLESEETEYRTLDDGTLREAAELISPTMAYSMFEAINGLQKVV